jgi:tRNA(fMet)-specific endonuclease VapC
MWMLDTNMCIYLIKRRPPQVMQQLQLLDMELVAISAVTVAELQFGIAKSKRPENAIALARFLAPFEILPFDELAADIYGNIRAELQAAGTPIGALDLLIAAHALQQNRTIVTNNTNEFRRVRGLRLENWTEPTA